MVYQALYRRFRPRRFGDVAGQDHITTILRNQITQGQVSHAYLFCGTRGTGKTSTAYILARALMCEQNVSGEACGQCPTCMQNAQGGTDIIEIDAASNNGVDEIRDLRDKVRFSPLYASRKVYIIDEVHMLTTAAFNALLKTLEEPPAHVVFILATTEPQRLPATILSRCQRYDFHRVNVPDIARRLSYALNEIGATVDDDGLRHIALSAEGSLRDALSLLDQCLAFFGSPVTGAQVKQALGSMDAAFLLDIADALIASDAARALLKLDEVVQSGRDLPVFARDLTQHFRSLMLLGACGEEAYSVLGTTREAFDALSAQARRCPLPRALRAITLLGEVESKLKYAAARVLLDATLVRLCRPEDERDALALEDRIASLEMRLQPSASIPAAEPPAPSASAAPPWDAVSPPAASPAAPQSAPPAELPSQPPAYIAPSAGAAAPQSEPGQIFEAVLAKLAKENLALYPLAKRYSHVTRDGNALVLHFTNTNAIYMEALQKPANMQLLTRLLGGVDPALQLRFSCSPRNDEALTRAKAFFGDDNVVIKKTLL